MHHLFHSMLELFPYFVNFLASIVKLYDGLTMIDMIGANHMNTIQFLQVSI